MMVADAYQQRFGDAALEPRRAVRQLMRENDADRARDGADRERHADDFERRQEILGERPQQPDDQCHLNWQPQKESEAVGRGFGLGVAARLAAPDQHIQAAESAEQGNRGEESPEAAQLVGEQDRASTTIKRKNCKACGMVLPLGV